MPEPVACHPRLQPSHPLAQLPDFPIPYTWWVSSRSRTYLHLGQENPPASGWEVMGGKRFAALSLPPLREIAAPPPSAYTYLIVSHPLPIKGMASTAPSWQW